MARRKRKALAIGIGNSTPPVRQVVYLIILSLAFFLATCFGGLATYKVTTMVLMCVTLLVGILCFPVLRDRIRMPLVILVLYVLLTGISTSYALSGKFALQEFSKLVIALCIALLLMMLTLGEGVAPGRRIAIILEGFVAFSSLLSVDLISTRLISTPVIKFLSIWIPDFSQLTALVPGTRMNSIFENPNIFGGCAGIGVMLALGLALSSQGKKERRFHLCCLYVIATAFILAFSMGAIAAIAVGFLAYLLLEHKDRRSELLLLMVKTFILVLVSVAVISMVAFDAWDGIQPIPLICLVVGAVLLCLVDRFVGVKLAEKLRGGVKSLVVVGVVLVLLVGFAVAAYNWTGPITLEEGESIWRGIYLEPGAYTVVFDGDAEVVVGVAAQSREDILLGEYPSIYYGDLSEVEFTVPKGSEVIFFRVTAQQSVELNSIQIISQNGNKLLPLDYKLLPDFISYRIQGLFTSQTAILRLSLFEDGLNLFKTSNRSL